MRRVLFWTTVASGALAAYLMYRRGENWKTIAKEAIGHPIGTMVDEVKATL